MIIQILLAHGVPPLLTIIPAGPNVLVEWPTNAPGFTLEYSTNLNLGAWSTALPAPGVVNTNYVVTNAISSTKRLFRLIGP